MSCEDKQREKRSLQAAIAVAIVNHNTCEHLHACLRTVERERMTEGVIEVIVVDNASTDGSVAMVQAEYSWIDLYANTTNPGYGAAANQAIAACQAPYVLLLNSDTRLLPGTLRALSAHLHQHPQAAIVGPRLVNPDGSLQPSCYPFPTPLNVFLEESALKNLIGLTPFLRNRYLRTWPHTSGRAVPWILGAALAIRRQPFETVGGFDTSFFMYAEEIDLCYRLHTAGWHTHFTPCATIVHVGGASTGRQRADMAVQYVRSMAHFYRRHYSSARLGQLIVILKCMVLARLLRDTVRLHLTGVFHKRARLAENAATWRRMLHEPTLTEMARG